MSVCECPFVVWQKKNMKIIAKSFLSLLCGNLLFSLLSGTWKMRTGCILKTDSHGSQEVDRNWERGTTDVTNTPYYNTLLAVFWAFSLGWKEKCVGLSGGALAIDIAHFKAKGMVCCELPPLQGWFVPLHSFAAHFSLSHLPPLRCSSSRSSLLFPRFYFSLPAICHPVRSDGAAWVWLLRARRSHFANTHWWWMGVWGAGRTGMCQHEYNLRLELETCQEVKGGG